MTEEKQELWLVLLFRLPAKHASARVAVWRRLKRYGALPLQTSGYVLPRSAQNRERMEWIATEIRSHKGQASVVEVTSFDDLSTADLKSRFLDARKRDYLAIGRELRKLLAGRKNAGPEISLHRLRRRFAEVNEIDFFSSPERQRIEEMLLQITSPKTRDKRSAKLSKAEFTGKIWLTRPRPGIDRVSSAWLIRRFIDARARFRFAGSPSAYPEAIPFDMFGSAEGFGHVGEDCTFETIVKSFGIRDPRVGRLAEAIHDADLADGKFGRYEAIGLDHVFDAWAEKKLPDQEILDRGAELIEALYSTIK